MALESKHKIDTSFSLSSMTDVIFLLLIFFMLTSSFITPSGLPVNLPTAKKSKIVLQKTSVTITKDLKYFINNKRVSESNLERELAREISGSDAIVTLHVDKSVPTEYLVKVAGIAASLNAKVSLATKPGK
ncbi:MAG: biopolymer transporter ExbD [Cyclobacteriaceae bacterium]|nr:biopolymer transporter ExbD [Cyclobacteriaceae bacterium]